MCQAKNPVNIISKKTLRSCYFSPKTRDEISSPHGGNKLDIYYVLKDNLYMKTPEQLPESTAPSRREKFFARIETPRSVIRDALDTSLITPSEQISVDAESWLLSE